MLPPSSSFLPSPLSLHKLGLNNKGIYPVEVSANGNKTTAVIWLGVLMWFSIQPRGHVWPQEAELEGRERTVSERTMEEDAGWSLGAYASSHGEVMWDGWAWEWLLTWGQWHRPPAELCEHLWNFSDPYCPVLGWCTDMSTKPHATACHKQDGSAGAALAGGLRQHFPGSHKNCRDGHVATWDDYAKWCVGHAGRCPKPSCPRISLTR